MMMTTIMKKERGMVAGGADASLAKKRRWPVISAEVSLLSLFKTCPHFRGTKSVGFRTQPTHRAFFASLLAAATVMPLRRLATF